MNLLVDKLLEEEVLNNPQNLLRMAQMLKEDARKLEAKADNSNAPLGCGIGCYIINVN